MAIEDALRREYPAQRIVELKAALAEYADPENWSDDEKWVGGTLIQIWTFFGTGQHPANVARKALALDAL